MLNENRMIFKRIAIFLVCALFFLLQIALAALYTTAVESFVTISGRIMDEDGHPIKDAIVMVADTHIATHSDASGSFSLEVPSLGGIRIVATAQGLLPFMSNPLERGRRSRLELGNIILYKSFHEQVVVTGTQTAKLYYETPIKTQVVDHAQIEKAGAKNLADSLEQFTGVRVENDCQNCGFNQVRINGMEGKYTQILVNGLPTISALAGIYVLEQIPADMIERLEVVKGGGSALYGGNAIAGIVNIITRYPSHSGTTLDIDQGLILGHTPEMALTFSHTYISEDRQMSAAFFATYNRRSALDENKDGFSDLCKLDQLTSGITIVRNLSAGMGKLILNAMANIDERRGGDMRTVAGTNMMDVPEHLSALAEATRTRKLDLSLGWEQALSGIWFVKADANFSHTRRNSYYGAKSDLNDPQGPNAYGLTRNPMGIFDLSATFSGWRRQMWVIGVSWNSDHIHDEAPAYDRSLRETFTDWGMFLQDEISLWRNKLSILAGIRADRHSALSHWLASPRASLIFRGLPDWSLRMTLATGFRAPQVFDEDLHVAQVNGQGQIIRNAADLDAERSWSLSCGADFGRQIRNTLWRLSISGFHNHLKNSFALRWIEDTENAAVFERYNASGAEVDGIEFEAGVKKGNGFEILSGWTWQRSRYDVPEGDFSSRAMLRTPDLYGYLRLSLPLGPKSTWNNESRLTGRMRVPHYAGYISEDRLETTPTFIEVDTSVTHKLDLGKHNELTLELRVQNLFNSFQNDLDYGLFRDSGYMYGPRRPRSVRFALRCHF